MAIRQTDQTIREEDFVQASPDTSSVLGAAFELGQSYTLIRQRQKRNILADFQKQGEKVEPKQLKSEFGVDFDKPMTRLAAQFVKDDIEERQRLEAIVNAGEGWFSGKVAITATTMLGAMADPIEFGIGAALGAGTGSLLKAAKAGKALQVGTAMVENTLAASLSEVEAYKAAKEGNFEEYTAQQALTNVMVGGIGLTAAFAAGGAALRNLQKLGTKHADVHFRVTDMAVQANKSPEIANLLDTAYSKDLEIDTNVQRALVDSLGEQGDDILAKSEDIMDVSSELNTRIRDGRIPQEDVDGLISAMADSGIDERKLNLMQERPEVLMSPEFKKNFREYMTARENDIDFSPEGRKILDEQPLEVETTRFDQDLELEAQNIRRNFEAQEDLPSDVRAEFDSVNKYVETENARVDAFEAYAACRRGIQL